MEHTQRGDPDSAHLTFTKVQVWGRVVRIPNSMHTKDHPAKKRMKMMMLAPPCYKKTKYSPTPLTHACLHWIYLDHTSPCFPCL